MDCEKMDCGVCLSVVIADRKGLSFGGSLLYMHPHSFAYDELACVLINSESTCAK
jgi:hypothetical protein